MPEPRSGHHHELVDIVNEFGDVIRVVERAEMRDHRLSHRCTYIGVVDTHGSLVVHQRADWKDVYPSYWDIAFGGVCGAGEQWLESAQRELLEEAGIADVELTDLGPTVYRDGESSIFGRVFLCQWDGEIRFDDGEVVSMAKVPYRQIRRWADGRLVCPDSLAALDIIVNHLDVT